MANLGFLNFLSGATQGYAGAQQQQQQMRADQRSQYLQMLWQQHQAQQDHDWAIQQALQQHGWDVTAAQLEAANEMARQKAHDDFEATQNAKSQRPVYHSFADFYDAVRQMDPDEQRSFIRNYNGENHTNFPLPGEVRNGVRIGFYGETPFDVMNKVLDVPFSFSPAHTQSSGRIPGQSVIDNRQTKPDPLYNFIFGQGAPGGLGIDFGTGSPSYGGPAEAPDPYVVAPGQAGPMVPAPPNGPAPNAAGVSPKRVASLASGMRQLNDNDLINFPGEVA